MKPNILFITTDQQRPELGCTGHPCLRTPHLDQLSTEGILFTQAYSDCPICIPARTTMITGMQSHVYGMPSFALRYRIERDRTLLLGSLMTKAGYQTRLIGKTHWHTEPDFRAGFECVLEGGVRNKEIIRSYGQLPATGIGTNELSPMLSNCPEEIQHTNWCISKSIDFLEDERDSSQPFFLWVSLVEPHPANEVSEPYYSMYDSEIIPDPVFPEWAEEDRCPYAIRQLRIGNAHAAMTDNAKRKARAVYYGKTTHVDHQLGRLLGALMKKGIWNSTAVFFTSDHGEHLFDYGTCFKSSFLEPTARLPFLVRFPPSMSTLRGTRSQALIELADLLPTFCDIAKIDPPNDITGKSIMPLVSGTVKHIRDFLHGQIDNSHMFHDGRYKYLYFADDGSELLFDKAVDVMDEVNLAHDTHLLNPIKQRFIEHLQHERSNHLSGGKLLNLHKKITPEDRRNVISWMGLTLAGR